MSKSMLETSTHPAKGNYKRYIGGGLIVFLISISPYLFYLYESFPSDTQSWETFLFTIKTVNYKSLYHLAWFFTGKAVPLYLLFIWFFTCKHWWHWIILVPICMYIFQLWGVINESYNIDEVEFIYMIPVMLVLVPTVYLIRAKLFHGIHNMESDVFEKSLSEKRGLWREFRDLFR